MARHRLQALHARQAVSVGQAYWAQVHTLKVWMLPTRLLFWRQATWARRCCGSSSNIAVSSSVSFHEPTPAQAQARVAGCSCSQPVCLHCDAHTRGITDRKTLVQGVASAQTQVWCSGATQQGKCSVTGTSAEQKAMHIFSMSGPEAVALYTDGTSRVATTLQTCSA